jgi:hypothetical protein
LKSPQSLVNGRCRGLSHLPIATRQICGARRGPHSVPAFWDWIRSTLAQIVETNEKDCRAVIEMLAAQLVKYFGAPDLATASLAAEEEIGFVASLCDHSPGVLVAVTRSHENGTIREQFRTLRSRGGAGHTNAFEFFEVVGDDEVPAEHLDLVGLEKGAHR